MQTYVERICANCQKPFLVYRKRVEQGRGNCCSQSCASIVSARLRFRPAHWRFWNRVDIAVDGCWLWTGSTNSNGYAQFQIGDRHVFVHRYAWELENGPIPKGLKVCHKCDVPYCVRNDGSNSHLFLGTQAENIHDAVTKNRMAQGEQHGMAKLADVNVIEIRRLHSIGLGAHALAEQFEIDTTTIYRIVHIKSWKHLPPNVP